MQQHPVNQDLKVPLAAVVNGCSNLKPVMLEPSLNQLCSAGRVLRTIAGALDGYTRMARHLPLFQGILARAGSLRAVDGMPHRLLASRLVT